METLIVIIIVGGCCVYIGRKFYKIMKAEPSSCGCTQGCDACATQSMDCKPPENLDRKKSSI